MKKEVFVVSNREELAQVIPEILSKGKNKILYIDDELSQGDSQISSGKYTISLESNAIGFDKIAIINKQITKRDCAAVYLRPNNVEVAAYIVLS